VQLFFGWEGVASWLPADRILVPEAVANAAAIKPSWSIGRDFGFALGIFAIFMLIGSTDFETIFAGARA